MWRQTIPCAPLEARLQAATPNVRNRSTAADTQRKGERGGGVARETGVFRRPTAAHRGRCALRRVGNVSALQLRHLSSSGRGVGDAAPYGLCVWVRFSGTVKYVGSLGIVFRIRYVVCRKAGFAAACRVHRPRCTMVT